LKYSLITPRRKKVISGDLQLALFFFIVSITMVAGTYIFLSYKTYDFKAKHEGIGKKIEKLNQDRALLEKKIETIETEVKTHNRITTDNTVMKESIRNLFDLVPDKITLTSAQLGEKSLVLSGITPSKDTYEFLLHAPLRSIFHRTYTSYYPAENGWYRFTSTNYLDDDTAVEVIE
jgi:cell division protein FtsL